MAYFSVLTEDNSEWVLDPDSSYRVRQAEFSNEEFAAYRAACVEFERWQDLIQERMVYRPELRKHS
jgi:hypothetical protein